MPIEIKICGLSTRATIQGAIAAGADYVGLVFYPLSPRNVDIETAVQLAEAARKRAKIVALIVDASNESIDEIAGKVKPDYFQAHGAESATTVQAITERTGIPVIKAIKVKEAPDIELARGFRDAADMILFDAKAPQAFANALPGGNGMAFDWTILSRSRAPKRFMLSGGLTPDNVAEAIRTTGAPIVDVSSGVEIAPGIKGLDLITRFIEAAREAR
jgi:phosphoribosylanthranilate isomerase